MNDDIRHALVIPPTGIMEVLHSETPIDPAAVLHQRPGGSFTVVTLTIGLLDDSTATLAFHPTHPEPNSRARGALALLTGVHIVLTGPVVLTGVPHHVLGEVVATLSLE